MIILGINGGVRLGYQDTSAALVIDGKLVAAVEEERLNRVKFAPGQIPQKAIVEVLSIAGINIQDVDYVATHGLTWGDEYSQVVESYFRHTFKYCPEVVRVHHHNAHAASAFYASGFSEAMVLTSDNSGDGVSTQLAVGNAEGIEVRERFSRPNSLGMFYSMISQFCGFARDSDEYKLMGLAAYGTPRFDLSDLMRTEGDFYLVNDAFLKEVAPGASQPSRQQPMFSTKLEQKLGMPARGPYENISEPYQDLAASAQHLLEEMLVHLVTNFHKKTGLRKLCLAGGTTLNCAANKRLMNLEFIDDIYIQPAAGDAGISLGAAYWVAKEMGDEPVANDHTYWGRSFSHDYLRQILELTGASFQEIGNPAQVAAERVAQNEVVAWFQGGAEYGPRALGNRSILANPTTQGMNDAVNQKIKFRESFRPFCPSILVEDSRLYFEGKQSESPYMTVTYDVNARGQSDLPAVTHTNATARIQTVAQGQNPLFYEYLQHMKLQTGAGATMNTSFNVKGEPMVYHPLDALRTFAGSGIDHLVMGNFVLSKSR